MPYLHRNSQKRIYEPGAEYFITTVTHDRHPYFANPILAELFVRDLWFAKELKEFDLFGYTVMPDHVHLLIQPKGKTDYSEIMRSVKTNFSRNANDIILNRGGRFPLRLEGDVTSHRLRDFQQYCHNVVEPLHQRFNAEYGANHGFPPFRWQKSFLDHIIRNHDDYLNHIEYIFHNAVKHGLVAEPEQYPFMWIAGMKSPFDAD